MKIRRFSHFGAALLLSLSALLTVSLPQVHATATTYYWCGGAGGQFDNSASWNTASDCTSGTAQVPTNDDFLVFDATGLSSQETVDDNANFNVGSISFTGGTGSGGYKIISSNSTTMILDGNIIDSTPGSALDLNIQLGNNVTVTESGSGNNSTTFGDDSNGFALDTNGHSLTFTDASGGGQCGDSVSMALVGSGSVNVSETDGNGGIILDQSSPNFSGAATASNGTLELQTPAALGGTSGVTVTNGGTLALETNGNNTYNLPMSLAGSGTGNSSIGALDVGQALIGCHGGGAPATDQATISGAVTLTGDAVYSGADNTTINGSYNSNGHNWTVAANNEGALTLPGGTVILPPAQNVTISSGDNQPSQGLTIYRNQVYTIDGTRGAVEVEYGGTLKGLGTVGQLNVDTGGIVAPGHSPGCLSTGNLVLNGIYQVDIGGTTACTNYDQLHVTGSVDVTGGTLSPSIVSGFVPKVGQKYTIITNDGSDAVSGTFTGIAEGGSFTSGGVTYSVTYKGGDGNDVVLTVTKVDASFFGGPNTGFRLAAAHPLTSLALTSLAALGLVFASRKLKPSRR